MRKLKNILVTGGAGFIGSNFIHYLFGKTKTQKKEFTDSNFSGNVINVDNLTYAGNLDNLTDIDNEFGSGCPQRSRQRYFFEKADICDKKQMELIFKKYDIDTVIHFAAETHVDRSIEQPDSFIKTNVLGTYNLLETAKSCWKISLENKRDDVIFHYISTDEVYGTVEKGGFFTEDSPYAPHSPYSASKASGEMIALSYFYTYSLPVTISNCSNNYGPYQFPEKFIPAVILNAINNKKIPIYGNGTNIRDWIFVEDHNRAVWKIMGKGQAGRKYNIGCTNEWENINLAKKILEIISTQTHISLEKLYSLISFVKDRPGHDKRYAIDCSRIKNELNWKPIIDFEEGLKLTVKWYLKNTKWIDNLK